MGELVPLHCTAHPLHTWFILFVRKPFLQYVIVTDRPGDDIIIPYIRD